MIKEALQYLSQVLREGNTPQIVEFQDGSQHAVWGDRKVVVEAPIPDRRHFVTTIESLNHACSRWTDNGTVWISDNAVVFVANDVMREDRVTLHLTMSVAFRALQELSNGVQWFSQRDFLRLLRVDLADANVPAGVVASVRRVTWSATSGADIGRGKESLGRSVEAAVASADDLPEQITLKTHVYCNEGCRRSVAVDCLLEVDPDSQQFALIPVGDSVDFAQQEALSGIATMLEHDAVFMGQPS